VFIARHGTIEFRHYDPYGQALAKLQRGHDRDWRDAREMRRLGLIKKGLLRELFDLTEPQLLRFPAIDRAKFRAALARFENENS
jgi:hypothetical protein